MRIFVGERLVRSVCLRVGVPTRGPFEVEDEAQRLCVRMDLLALGDRTGRVEHQVRLDTQPTIETDWAVRLAHAREWAGEASAVVARSLANDALDVATAAVGAVLERVQRLRADGAPEAFDELVASLEAQRVTMAEAAHDRAQLRELSARSASHASTVRNGGRSLGSEGESATQASMRSQSMAY